MILITGGVTVRPECREQALALGLEHSRRSRAEGGCISHDCHVDAENPDRIVFVERWSDLNAVAAHFAVPASGQFVQNLAALALSQPEMQIYQAEAMPWPGKQG